MMTRGDKQMVDNFISLKSENISCEWMNKGFWVKVSDGDDDDDGDNDDDNDDDIINENNDHNGLRKILGVVQLMVDGKWRWPTELIGDGFVTV